MGLPAPGLQAGLLNQPTAQIIPGSLKFDSASSQYLSSTSTFQNTKSYEMTFSFWLKRCAPTAAKATQYIFSTNVEGTIFFDSGNSDKLSFNLRGSSGSNFFTTTNAELRDFNAWYHVVVALNLGSGTQSQRFKCYINNVEQTMSSTSYPSNAYHTGGTWYIGAYKGGPSHFPDYYLSNFYCISGQVLDPSYFGFTDPLTNTWRPKKYTGTFTFDNSFYLPLDNQDNFEKDKSGEGNHFTKNNFSGTSSDPNVVKDSPSGVVFGGPPTTGITTTSSGPANYCTFNPQDKDGGITLSNGNLTLDHNSGSTIPFSRTTIGMNSGKYYFEVTRGSGAYGTMGICTIDSDLSMYAGRSSNAVGGYEIYTENNEKWAGGTGGTGAGYLTQTWDESGAVASCYFDADKGTVGFMVNGTDMGIAFDKIDMTKTYYFQCGSQGTLINANFGQKPFKYAPPDGFLPLSSATIRPELVISRPDQYVGIVTYTGDNSGTRDFRDFNFAPDFIWYKERTNTGGNWSHTLFDTVRGSAVRLHTNSTNAETAEDIRFLSDGFGTTDAARQNTNNANYVAWCWRAGGNKNTFNVDDVGYASAAGASMSAGALNSVAFNKDQIWSGLISPASGTFDQAATNAFNGNIVEGDPDRLRTSGNNILVTMTFSTSVNVLSQVKVYGETDYNSTCTITVNGVTHTSSTGRIHTFNVSGSLTQMTIVTNESSSRTYMEGMEIDGKQLVDTNISTNAPSLAPTGCSVGTKQGFSIVGFTGPGSTGTYSHGLSQKPDFMIFKNRDDNSSSWLIYHSSVGAKKYLDMTNAVPVSSSNPFNNTEPTNFVFTAGNWLDNGSTKYISYIWHNVPGLQKFGHFEGDENNKPFIETGFRPAIVWIKAIDQTWYWNVQDSERSPINPSQGNFLRFDQTYVENSPSSNNNIDFLSNGFKVYYTNQSEPTNVNNQTYIYCAWAEQAAYNLFGGQSNAR